MFQIFMLIGWAVLLVLVLYLWADVREIAGLVRESRREQLRSSFGGRDSGKERNFREDAKERPDGTEPQEIRETERGPAALKESEEQVLQEILAEFLG